VSNVREPVHTYPEKKLYTCCLTVSNQYDTHTFCRDVDLLNCSPTSTNQVTAQSSATGFASMNPSPSYGPLQLAYELHAGRYDGQLRMYNLQGQEVLSRELKVHTTSYLFSIEHLPSGLYYWSLIDGTGQVGSGKVVKVE
jgi:hypothetical protein